MLRSFSNLSDQTICETKSVFSVPGARLPPPGGGDQSDPRRQDGGEGRREEHQGRLAPEDLQGRQGDRQGRVPDRQVEKEAGNGNTS